MRKSVFAPSLAAATALAMPAFAQQDSYTASDPAAAPIGVVGGTVVGLGIAEGWFGAAPAVGGAALATSTVGAAAVGGVAGIGGIALVDAIIQPCRGFHAALGMNREFCAAQNHYVLPEHRVANVPVKPARRVRVSQR